MGFAVFTVGAGQRQDLWLNPSYLLLITSSPD